VDVVGVLKLERGCSFECLHSAKIEKVYVNGAGTS